jgi:hypothetical protein
MQNMKQKIYHIIIFLLFWFCGIAYSQNPKADILRQDLSGLFDNSSMIGILGEDCSRIDIHITEVRKVDNREYGIKGVSRTRLFLICPFEGNIYIDSISSCSQIMKSECTEVDGFIYGHYSFAEYGDKQYRGTFSGSFKQGYRMSGQQIEKGRNEMAELKLNLSEYRGKWKSAKGLTKICSWAFYNLHSEHLECPAILGLGKSLLTEYTYSHHQRKQTLQVLINSTANHKKHFQERFVPTP